MNRSRDRDRFGSSARSAFAQNGQFSAASNRSPAYSRERFSAAVPYDELDDDDFPRYPSSVLRSRVDRSVEANTRSNPARANHNATPPSNPFYRPDSVHTHNSRAPPSSSFSPPQPSVRSAAQLNRSHAAAADSAFTLPSLVPPRSRSGLRVSAPSPDSDHSSPSLSRSASYSTSSSLSDSPLALLSEVFPARSPFAAAFDALDALDSSLASLHRSAFREFDSFDRVHEQFRSRFTGHVAQMQSAIERVFEESMIQSGHLERARSRERAPSRRSPRVHDQSRSVFAPESVFDSPSDHRPVSSFSASRGGYSDDSDLPLDYDSLLALDDRVAKRGISRTTRKKLEKSKISATRSEAKKSDCSICLESFNVGISLIRLSCCAGQFHPDCILKWLETSKSCPNCRAEVK